jgi:hypothetical protein
VYHYTKSFTGFSARLTPEQADRISSMLKLVIHDSKPNCLTFYIFLSIYNEIFINLNSQET